MFHWVILHFNHMIFHMYIIHPPPTLLEHTHTKKCCLLWTAALLPVIVLRQLCFSPARIHTIFQLLTFRIASTSENCFHRSECILNPISLGVILVHLPLSAASLY